MDEWMYTGSLLAKLEERFTYLSDEGRAKYHEVRSEFGGSRALGDALESLGLIWINPAHAPLEGVIGKTLNELEPNAFPEIKAPNMILVSINELSGLPEALVDLDFDELTGDLFVKIALAELLLIENEFVLCEGPTLLRLLLAFDPQAGGPMLANSKVLKELTPAQVKSTLRQALGVAKAKHHGLITCTECGEAYGNWAGCPNGHPGELLRSWVMEAPIHLAAKYLEGEGDLNMLGIEYWDAESQAQAVLAAARRKSVYLAYVNNSGKITLVIEWTDGTKPRPLQFRAIGPVWIDGVDDIALISKTYLSRVYMIESENPDGLKAMLENYFLEASAQSAIDELASIPGFSCFNLGVAEFRSLGTFWQES